MVGINVDGSMKDGSDHDPRVVTLPHVVSTMFKAPETWIRVYMDDGRVFTYQVPNQGKAREHASAIVATGYRHVDKKDPFTMEHYPPHRIVKVKVVGPIQTNYTDETEGT